MLHYETIRGVLDMYITRFTRTDKKTEDYLYNTEEEAMNHLKMFLNDDSSLYHNISVLDGKNNVLHILPYINGKPCKIVSAGSCVRLRDEFMSDEERKSRDIFVVTNLNEWSGRANITCLTTGMILKPTEMVGIEMVEPIAE